MEESNQDTCYSGGSVAGAVIGTFFTTILLLAVAALLYKQWRRHKGKHLVLVTDPEIVEDAYAFDNPCFKDATLTVGRSIERPVSPLSSTPTKDTTRWSSPWSTLGLATGNRKDKKRTLDDSCLGPKATRVSVVSLRSRDFTGLGFNVCGNMREGIFVKDLLHRGPASESGRIHPGDRIASVKISFRSMVYEDALTILSYASPYDVELEVESGGIGTKPTTLLKKSIGPTPIRICHPLYRSQSIPEFSKTHKSSAKRLFIADPNESLSSNYSTMNNSTLKSSKSTPGSQTLERRHEYAKINHHNHYKFGIKVLPALDGTVHRIENQNEHNTNLERRNSKKTNEFLDVVEEAVGKHSSNILADKSSPQKNFHSQVSAEKLQQRDNGLRPKTVIHIDGLDSNGIDTTDHRMETLETVIIPSEVPTEVHNAAVAARRNRKNSPDLMTIEVQKSLESKETTQESTEESRSPQKGKRKAPAPPKYAPEVEEITKDNKQDMGVESNDKIDMITDYSDTADENVKYNDDFKELSIGRRRRLREQTVHRRNSESDTDSEVQNNFTTIELNSADITIHHTPVPEVEDNEDDIYRKAASLGDLSKYESRAAATLERAQSLDMTDTSLKKRKAPLPPEDINELTEDLTKLDEIDTFDRRKLKKSNEWGTLEDAIWSKEELGEMNIKDRVTKKSNGTLERSKSAVEIKLKEDADGSSDKRLNVSDGIIETSIELYSLPLSKRLTHEFIQTERLFDLGEDNSLARIVNNGRIVKSPTPKQVDLDFRQNNPLPDDSSEEEECKILKDGDNDDKDEVKEKAFQKAISCFDFSMGTMPLTKETKIDLVRPNDDPDYAGREAVVEEAFTKVTVDYSCPGCNRKYGRHNEYCSKRLEENQNNMKKPAVPNSQVVDSVLEESPISKTDNNVKVESSTSQVYLHRNVPKYESAMTMIRVEDPTTIDDDRTTVKETSTLQMHRIKFEQTLDSATEDTDPVINYTSQKSPTEKIYDTHYTKRIMNVMKSPSKVDNNENDYEFGSGVTMKTQSVLSTINQHNVSNISVSSGENSEDSGLVRESSDSETRPPLPSTPVPSSPQKMTYITEIKVSTNRDKARETDSNMKEIASVVEGNDDARKLKQDNAVTSNGKTTPGKKPPVPPRRTDMSKTVKEEPQERQVVYVSEYKSVPTKETQSGEDDKSPSGNRKYEHWVYLNDNKDQNPWGNGSSSIQPITNIVFSSGDEKVIHK